MRHPVAADSTPRPSGCQGEARVAAPASHIVKLLAADSQQFERSLKPQVLSEDSHELAAGEVAERLSLHKSTIHRLLTVLDQQRLIRRNTETGRYALGLRLFS